MMSVFVVVMSMCSPSEGCLEERRPTAYTSRAECMETVATMPSTRGIKYRCASTPQFMVSEDRRATKSHLVTTAASATTVPESSQLKP
jgi:hypothetical protein